MERAVAKGMRPTREECTVELVLKGAYQDVIKSGGAKKRLVLPKRTNAVVYRALDLIAGLLANTSGLRGMLYWAVGTGDSEWDDSPPTPDQRATRLVNEIYRQAIDPDAIRYDPDTNTIAVQLLLELDARLGPIREFGLFGGDASPRPGTGYMINHGIHPPIDHSLGERLQREVRLTISSGGSGQAAHLVAALLCNAPGMRGIQYWAVGTGYVEDEEASGAADTESMVALSAALPQSERLPTSLAAELYRKPIHAPRDIVYDAAHRTLEVRTEFAFDEAVGVLREFGLLGGNATTAAGSGLLIHRQVHEAIDKHMPFALKRSFQLKLGSEAVVRVPDVTGLPLADARLELENAALAMGEVDEVEQPFGQGEVIGQMPEAGAVVAEGTRVRLTVAVAPRVVVPTLHGLTLAEAAEVLEQAGLALHDGPPRVAESPALAETVIEQRPLAGERVDAGTVVEVVLATPVTTEVPDLTGLAPGAAAVLLERAQLSLAPPPYPVAGREEGHGTTVDQVPPPGTRVPVGSEVVITVAAPHAVAVPNLLGLTPDEAAMALAGAAGGDGGAGAGPGQLPDQPALALGVVSEVEREGEVGKVVAQSPQPGETAPLFGTVDVQIAVPITVEMPHLIGQPVEAASKALEAIGLALGRVTYRQDVATRGLVIEQALPPGSRVRRGSAVDLVVAEPVLVPVPELIGHRLDYAQEVVLSRGLTLGKPVKRVSEEAEGTIVDQTPAAGELLPLYGEVGIAVAVPKSPTIPDPVPDPDPTPVDHLVGAFGWLDDALYVHGTTISAEHLFQALFEGPFDQRKFMFQPVIFDGPPEVEIRKVEVHAGAPLVVDGRIIPAPRNQAAEQMTVIFRLREGLRWSDGEPVTAMDSVHTMELAARGEYPASRWRLDRTESYEASDERTVVWTGLPGWLDAVPWRNFWLPVSPRVLEDSGRTGVKRDELITLHPSYGPYRVKEHRASEWVVFERHPAYFDEPTGLPMTDQIVLRTYESGDVTLSGLLAGEIDFALSGSLGLSQVRNLREAEQSGEIQVYLQRTQAQEYLMFNVDPKRSPYFADPRVRQALAYAIDRKHIIEAILPGELTLAHSFVAPDHPFYTADLPHYPYDSEMAIQLLNEAGLRDFAFTLTIRDGDPTHKIIAQMLHDHLAQVGIRMNVQPVEANELFARHEKAPLFGRHFEAALVGWAGGVEPPAELFLCSEVPGVENGFHGANLSGYCNPEFDAVALAAMGTQDTMRQRELWWKAQEIFAHDLPALPLYQHVKVAATRSGMQGFMLDPSDPSEMSNVERFR